MRRKLLRKDLLSVGMILTLVVSNSATTSVYAAQNTALQQSIHAEEIPEEVITTESGAELDTYEVSEEEIDAYFNNSVFVGDSIMLGFRNYCMKQKDSFLNHIQFLAAGSFSVTNALWDVTEKSVHPVYKGQKRQIWESISMMETPRVFLFFGMNDLNVSGLEGTCEKYKELISKIKEKSPDVEIHIISMTYTLKDAGKGKLNNDTIREFNELLKVMASENGWGYLDMATPLSDENGNLTEQYCSDGFVHQSRAAYDVWTTVIRDYARAQLDGTTEYPAGDIETEESSEVSETLPEILMGTTITDMQTPTTDFIQGDVSYEPQFRLSAGFSTAITTIE